MGIPLYIGGNGVDIHANIYKYKSHIYALFS